MGSNQRHSEPSESLQKCLLLPKQAWLHLNLSKTPPAFIQLNSIRATTFGRRNFNNIKMILLCLPNQFLFFSIEWIDVLVVHAKITMFVTNSSIDTVRWPHLPHQTFNKYIDGFRVTVSLWNVAYILKGPLCQKPKRRAFYPAWHPIQYKYCHSNYLFCCIG